MRRDNLLTEATTDNDPFNQFDKWYREYLRTESVNPDSFSLATSDLSGSISVRTVLLKEYNRDGFVFFTNYNSRKGRHISVNQNVAMLFYWPAPGRQIRIEGTASRISVKDSLKYFSSRPRESRIGAWASKQDEIIPDRNFLDSRFLEYEKKFRGKGVPKPPYWGGFRITPFWFEFWQEGEHRLHDRIVYQLSGSSWTKHRLSP